MKTETLFSSANCEWETPPELFNELDERFHFTLDVASTDQNALCERHYTKEQNGLIHGWQTGGGICMVQSSLRQGHKSMGTQSMGGIADRASDCHVDPGPDRYGVVSRLHLSQGRCGFPERAIAFRSERSPGGKQCGVSVHACDL